MTTIHVIKVVTDYLKIHVGKPCPTNYDISFDLDLSYDQVRAAMRHIDLYSDIPKESRAGKRRYCFDGQWTLWTAPRKPTPVAKSVIPEHPHTYSTRSACPYCGTNSDYGCQHMRLAA